MCLPAGPFNVARSDGIDDRVMLVASLLPVVELGQFHLVKNLPPSLRTAGVGGTVIRQITEINPFGALAR